MTTLPKYLQELKEINISTKKFSDTAVKRAENEKDRTWYLDLVLNSSSQRTFEVLLYTNFERLLREYEAMKGVLELLIVEVNEKLHLQYEDDPAAQLHYDEDFLVIAARKAKKVLEQIERGEG